MKSDNDRIAKVLEAIEDEALAGVNDEFTFDRFCREHKLYGEHDTQKLQGVFICCPFHKEKTPSLLIDESGRRFKCFGCGAGWRYIDFIVKYDREVLGIDTSVGRKVNEILKNNRRLQAKLGFSSIYHKEMKTISAFEPVKHERFSIKKSLPKSYVELAEVLKNKRVSKSIIIFAVALMQKGLAPEVIYNQIIDYKEPEASIHKYTIKELEEE